MDDQVQIPTPVSSGATDNPNAPQQGGPPPLPEGASSQAPAAPPLPEGASYDKPDTENEPANGSTSLGQHAEDFVKGGAESFAHGMAGAGELGNKLSGGMLDKAAEAIGNLAKLPKFTGGANPYESAQAAIGSPKNISEQAGYGGENLLEIISGDEALKGLSLSEKMLQTGKVAQILEKAPKLMEYLKLGANAAKGSGELNPEELAAVQKSPLLTRMIGTVMDAARLGTAQTGQTLARTGGDVKEAVKQGAETAGSAGVLGAAFGMLGRAAEKAGDVATTVKNAGEAGANAVDPNDLSKSLANQINDAETKMHGDFESGIQKLKGDLGDQKVPYQGSPLQKAAKATLEGITDKQVIPGKTETTGILDEFGNQITKQGADKTVRTTKGALPEFGSLAGGSPESKNILNALADPKKTGDLTIDELIQRRQQLGEKIGQLTKGATSSTDRADVQVYQKLRDGIDDTIQSLAKNSGKPEASQDYEALRGAYKDKVKLFQSPAIQNLSDPGVASDVKLDNASKYLLAGGNKIDKVNTLSEVIGEQGVKDLGKGIIQRQLADASSESGQLNPAKFVKNFKQIDSLPPEVKDKLFDPDVINTGLDKLSKDLKSAANYQKLVRAGLLSGASAVGGAAGGAVHAGGEIGGLGIALGLMGEKGTDLLDKVANNPKIWSAFRTAGKIGATLEQSPAARRLATAAKYGAGNALGNVLQGAEPLANDEDQNHVVYSNQ